MHGLDIDAAGGASFGMRSRRFGFGQRCSACGHRTNVGSPCSSNCVDAKSPRHSPNENSSSGRMTGYSELTSRTDSKLRMADNAFVDESPWRMGLNSFRLKC
jgi:hypothetical protein